MRSSRQSFHFGFWIAFALLFSGSARAQRYVQQGGVLQKGLAASVSFDGNTAVIGDPYSGSTGGAYVLNRSGGVWTQVGPELVGTGSGTYANQQGVAVSLSADGNTILIGGPYYEANNLTTGASWVFTKVNGTWVQQGGKLIGVAVPGGPTPIYQGTSVSLSADGNTAVIGATAHFRAVQSGLLVVFTRSNGVWTQQGPALAGSDQASPPVHSTYDVSSVAISSDGNTAMLGVPSDGPINSDFMGATWIFTRFNGVWTQQGSKLVGNGVSGTNSWQGWSVALSADGNTAVSGGPADSDPIPYANSGALWVFTRSNGAWTQQGPKLTGSAPSSVFFISLGILVSISADGNTIVAGTHSVLDSKKGEAPSGYWLFTRHDGVWGQAGLNPFPGTATGTDGYARAAISGDSGTIILFGQPAAPFQTGDQAFAYVAPILKASITDSGNFFRGEIGANFTLSVSNVGPLATPSQVTLAAVIHTGLTATGLAGNGWSCALSTLKCTRTDPLAPGAAYPPVTLTVNIASDAPSSVVATAGAWGGYSNSSSTTDHVTVR